MHRQVRSALALLVLTPIAATQLGAHAPGSLAEKPLARLFATVTTGPGAGGVIDVQGGPPWTVQPVAPTSGGTLVRRFGGNLFVVDTVGEVIDRIPKAGTPVSWDFGFESRPQDVWITSGALVGTAWVTRRDNPLLARVDPTSGAIVGTVDLSPVGAGAPIQLGTMIQDGARLFVQVKIVGAGPGGIDRGALAVVDWAAGALVDVDPAQLGVQGIALDGAPPRLKMQIVAETRTLFVSASEGIFDGRGAIEMVDLDSLASIGAALSEKQTAELSGFVMTSPTGGWFVQHTDFAASTHLLPFTLAGGPADGPEVIVLLGDQVSSLAYDERERRLYLPSGFANGPTGIWVVDTETETIVGGGPIPTGAPPRDVIVAR